jgi:leader peptidase (prepilin peptidase)/N-methyltransferase
MNSLPVALTLALSGACCGAVAGSFLNVLIHRVPALIDRADGQVALRHYVSALSKPASHCTYCGQALLWRDNIPVVSYLALGGRCRACGTRYGARYLIVELLTAAAFAYCTVIFGLTAQGFLASVFLAGLLALSAIDIEEQLLPDVVLAPLLCLGVLFQALYGGLTNGLLGALGGYAILWLVRESYRRFAGVEGMGYGDVKFAAAIGAWIGVGGIPAALFIAFAGGTALMLPLSFLGRIGKGSPIPFGPFLAFGGLCSFVLPKLPEFAAGMFIPP